MLLISSFGENLCCSSSVIDIINVKKYSKYVITNSVCL